MLCCAMTPLVSSKHCSSWPRLPSAWKWSRYTLKTATCLAQHLSCWLTLPLTPPLPCFRSCKATGSSLARPSMGITWYIIYHHTQSNCSPSATLTTTLVAHTDTKGHPLCTCRGQDGDCQGVGEPCVPSGNTQLWRGTCLITPLSRCHYSLNPCTWSVCHSDSWFWRKPSVASHLCLEQPPGPCTRKCTLQSSVHSRCANN